MCWNDASITNFRGGRLCFETTQGRAEEWVRIRVPGCSSEGYWLLSSSFGVWSLLRSAILLDGAGLVSVSRRARHVPAADSAIEIYNRELREHCHRPADAAYVLE